jgi:RimJ/RimL family protein N-acetyltransferase
MLIRPIQVTDAAAFAALLDQLDHESKFLMFEPGERNLTAAHLQSLLEEMLASDESTIFVAEHEGGLVGFLRARGETLRRVRHAALIVVAVRQSYIGQGIGTRLFAAVEEWARTRNLHRLHLTVMTHNHRAVALYQKLGFVIEGLHRDALLVDGRYVDEFTMAKLLD